MFEDIDNRICGQTNKYEVWEKERSQRLFRDFGMSIQKDGAAINWIEEDGIRNRF